MLKLIALDEEDLQIVSAHVQDAVLHVADIAWRPGEKRFALGLNRFAWEVEPARRSKGGERRNAVLRFDRVTSVRTSGIDRAKPEMVLSLLAIGHQTIEPAPSATIELVFAGDAAIRLDVECVEAELVDLGGAWATPSRPHHES